MCIGDECGLQHRLSTVCSSGDDLPKPTPEVPMTSSRVSLLALLLLAATLTGCDGPPFGTPPDPEPPPQTEILEIRLDPDTVAVGDTVLIHVVIRDSLDTRFVYEWGLDEDRVVPVDGTTMGPKIRYIAPRSSDVSGEVDPIRRSVEIDNGSTDSTKVVESFRIPILN